MRLVRILTIAAFAMALLSCGGDGDALGPPDPPEPIDECLDYQLVHVDGGWGVLEYNYFYVVRTEEEHAQLVEEIQEYKPDAEPPPMPEPGMMLVGLTAFASGCDQCSEFQCVRYTGDVVTMEAGVWQEGGCWPHVTFIYWILTEDKGVPIEATQYGIPRC